MGGGVAAGIKWEGARDAAKCSKVNRTDPTTRSSPVPNVTVPGRRNPDLAYEK